MKKTQFRIRLFNPENKVAELTTLKAAQFNADEQEMDINLLFAFAMTIKEMGKHSDTTVELVGENQLCIDCKINSNWQQGLIVEQIEVFENVYVVDEDDLLTDILTGARYPKN